MNLYSLFFDPEMEWQHRAQCADADPSHADLTADTATQLAFKERWCDRCPVSIECAAFAIRHPEQTGVYGGLVFDGRNNARGGGRLVRFRESPRFRRDERGRSPHGTHAAYVRHRAAREIPCDLCLAGERDFQAARYQQKKARKRKAEASTYEGLMRNVLRTV